MTHIALPTAREGTRARRGKKSDSAVLIDRSRANPTPLALPVGSPRCRCEACGEHFTSVSGFDKHQSLDLFGDVRCYDPASIGLVCNDGWWSYPLDPRYAKGVTVCPDPPPENSDEAMAVCRRVARMLHNDGFARHRGWGSTLPRREEE